MTSVVRVTVRCLSTTFLRSSDRLNAEKATHTGQIWSKEDYRRFRFVGREKLVNPSFAVNIIAEDPVVVVDSNHVFSNSGGALGHPKVYINLDKPEGGVCGYSGKKFIQAKFYNTNQHGPSISYEEYLKQIQH
ncbi:NADH dehydrogenase [ubiquinone] iron-sulfur protein 6, mitochondrial-like isoform X1 [Pomacea canaliculata]|uniref:NADH dehydrogenase [ubiquinone] iron-sulfur protein 6, mitochondrial-like isoform X1 n=1 Tax=Pomacea canaliculata TaxID=400727 RepID=UPI000D73A890|nr:NADH dehydrogenase [ubiquinone] iron-sulfur protein 6, mitochondrial-like isoform X1 [Pomacea canaliculata]